MVGAAIMAQHDTLLLDRSSMIWPRQIMVKIFDIAHELSQRC
jgi:hypothetical protein